jgi:hypothetical protein
MFQDCSTISLAGAATVFLPKVADDTTHIAPGMFVLIEIVCDAAIASVPFAIVRVARTNAVPIVFAHCIGGHGIVAETISAARERGGESEVGAPEEALGLSRPRTLEGMRIVQSCFEKEVRQAADAAVT